jgi:hypothetical protein
MPDVKQYDFGLVNLAFKGVMFQGFADGDSIAVALDEDAYTDVVGSGGDVVRTRNRNTLGDMTVRLLAESPTNDRLSAIADLDAAGLGRGPLTLTNLNGTTILSAASAWIKKRPDVAYGKESGVREWVLRVVFDIYNVGGALI